MRWLLLLPLLAGCLRWQSEPLPRADRQIVPIGATEVHVVDEGPRDAPAVVLIHGFASNLQIWSGLAAALQVDRRVVRLDLPGFGWTSRYEGDYSRDAMADAVLGVMDRLGVERADLVAHSMGSGIALTVALRAPSRVRSVAVVGAWLFEEQVPWALRDARQPGIGELIFGAWFAEHLDARMRHGFWDPEPFVTEEVLQGARRGLRRPGARAAALATIRGLHLPELDAALPSVRAPVLVVHGREDPVAQVEYAERLAVTLPDARLIVLPQVGHFPMLEAPSTFEARLSRWLHSL